EFDHRALQSQANSEIGNAARAGVANRLDFALDSAHSEAAGNQDSVDVLEEFLGAARIHILGLDTNDLDLREIRNPGVVERLVYGLVRIAVLHVLAHDGDPYIVLGMHDPLDHCLPLGEVERAARNLQSPDQELIKAVGLEAERYLVNTDFLV